MNGLTSIGISEYVKKFRIEVSNTRLLCKINGNNQDGNIVSHNYNFVIPTGAGFSDLALVPKASSQVQSLCKIRKYAMAELYP